MVLSVTPSIQSKQLEFSLHIPGFRTSKLRHPISAAAAGQVKASSESSGSSTTSISKKGSLISVISVTSHELLSKAPRFGLTASIGVGAALCLLLALKVFSKALRSGVPGSVSELIRRGQLRSDRKADLRPLKYEDPFNNPMMKVGSKNPLVRMCGKIFRLAPVTLTEEKVASHQNRRIQAYQWRRPVIFLNEGEPIPDGVDPDEVRWIPSNHPFATTTDYIDEESAQKNVFQTRGVPSRVRAEHEALRKKMKEASQKKAQIDPNGRTFKDKGGLAQPSQHHDASIPDSGSFSDERVV